MDFSEIRKEFDELQKAIDAENERGKDVVDESSIPSEDMLRITGRTRSGYVAALGVCMKLKRVLRSRLFDMLIDYGKAKGLEILSVMPDDVPRIREEKCETMAFYWPIDESKDTITISYNYATKRRGKYSQFLGTDWIDMLVLEWTGDRYRISRPDWERFHSQVSRYLVRAENQPTSEDSE